MRKSNRFRPVFYPAGVLLLWVFLFDSLPAGHPGKRIQVGPDKTFKTPGLAARYTGDGDTVDIDAGVYEKDAAVWTANNLLLRGVGGRVHLKSAGVCAEDKGIWVIKGSDVRIENIEFSGAMVDDGNGAGIREEGKNLHLYRCYFHDNQDGILTSNNPQSEVIIENSEFADNGTGDGLTHNVYIGRIRKLTFQFCYSHHAHAGHTLKSRAAENIIQYNELADEKEGDSSYLIDLPNGGSDLILGNIIQQGLNAENSILVSVGSEGNLHEQNRIYIVNNTFYNYKGAGIFIKVNPLIGEALIQNNIFAGAGSVMTGKAERISNLETPDINKRFSFLAKHPGFRDAENYDYHLIKGSPAVDQGTELPKIPGLDLTPVWQYVHPASAVQRPVAGPIDIGAFEYQP
jgi:hypothetical protein